MWIDSDVIYCFNLVIYHSHATKSSLRFLNINLIVSGIMAKGPKLKVKKDIVKNSL